MVEHIKVLITYHQEPVLDVDKLDTLLEHVCILVSNRYTHKVHLWVGQSFYTGSSGCSDI